MSQPEQSVKNDNMDDSRKKISDPLRVLNQGLTENTINEIIIDNNITNNFLLFRRFYFYWLKQGDDKETVLLNQSDGYLMSSITNDNEEAGMTPTNGNKTINIGITRRNLICWAFQIASGMDHLANKKV